MRNSEILKQTLLCALKQLNAPIRLVIKSEYDVINETVDSVTPEYVIERIEAFAPIRDLKFYDSIYGFSIRACSDIHGEDASQIFDLDATVKNGVIEAELLCNLPIK